MKTPQTQVPQARVYCLQSTINYIGDIMKNFAFQIIRTALPVAALTFFACDGSSSSSSEEFENFPESSSIEETDGSSNSATEQSKSSDSSKAISSSDKQNQSSNSKDSDIQSMSSEAGQTVSSSSGDIQVSFSSSSSDMPVQPQSSSSINAVPTLPGETFTDSRDGKTYKLAKIGTQVWMAEDLQYGDSALYNFDDAQKVCPQNFHLPTLKELQTLVQFAGGADVAGKKLKSATGWPNDEQYGDWNGTDDFGFNAKPVASGDGKGTDENFWSSTRNSRDYSSADFLKINAHPTSQPETTTPRYNDFNSHCVIPAGANSSEYTCFVNGVIETKLSVRCLSNTGDCGGKSYDNTKQFCQNGSLYDICRQRTYDGTKYECKNDTLYEKSSGNVFKFTWFMLNPEKTYSTIQDERDGQFYKTIDIDGVVWFAENLNYKSNGSLCPANEEKLCDVYGRLYTEKQVMDSDSSDFYEKHQGLCPKGTHIATATELVKLLEKFSVYDLFTAYTLYFEDDDFYHDFRDLNNNSGLCMLENGDYDNERKSWDGLNREAQYIGSNFKYYLYYRWAPSGIGEAYSEKWATDDKKFGSVRCIVD